MPGSLTTPGRPSARVGALDLGIELRAVHDGKADQIQIGIRGLVGDRGAAAIGSATFAALGLISAPTLRADGSVLDKPEYDEKSGLFFENKGVDFGLIPINPAKDDALAALKELLEPIAEFSFVDETSKSVQLARMLTSGCRTAIFTSPLFGYTAPSARTGKSMLVDIACILSHGHAAPVLMAAKSI